MKVRKVALMVFLIIGMLSFSGCMSWKNDMKARGGFLGEHSGDYVVVSQSGGEIMDCWILDNVYVESVASSDGWRFVDEEDNTIYIGGDVKVIRLDSSSDIRDKYFEYHMEFEEYTYRQKFNL